MRLTFAFISNYKSINKRQKLMVDDKVTAIIGKNESGKSNIIDILGGVNLITGINETILKNTNKMSEDDSSEVELESEFNHQEVKKLNLGIDNRRSNFIFSNNFSPYKIKISGGISVYFQSNKYKEYIGKLNQFYSEVKVKMNDTSQKQDINTRLESLSKASSYIIQQYKENLTIIQQRIKPLMEKASQEHLDRLVKDINEYFQIAYSIFPIFHKFSDSTLKSQYTMNKDFFDKFNSQDEAIKNLITASNCTLDEWKSAILDDRLNSKGIDAKNKIQRGIKALEEGFNQFYSQEENVKIVTNMDSTVFQIYIDTTGNSIAFTERSNGLQWYFNLYIDLLSNQLTDKSVIFLIDEPGVFLHVDAQKEVLNLFDYLTKDTNQIIYTTHSPFMIDEMRTYRIRPIQKTGNGFTHIFSSIQSDEIEMKSRVETLSPLLEALGMKLYQNIGMQEGFTHIVTEGISDAIYLDTMIKHLGLNNVKPIPSRGASNVVDMTFILWGLGYSFKTLFDQDKAGRDGANEVILSYTKGLSETEVSYFKEKYIFMVTDAFDSFDINRNYTIESLIDPSDYKALNADYSYEYINKNKNDKILMSKYFCDSINNAPDKISENTKSNFRKLFKKIVNTGL